MKKVLIIGGYPKSLINFRGRLIESFLNRGYEVVACAGGECEYTSNKLSKLGVKSIFDLNEITFFF